MIGINLPRSAREQFHEGMPVDTGDLSIGDLVFFRTYASFPSHVGIYLGDNLFIHASSRGKKVTIDKITEPFYTKRFIGAKRVIGEDTLGGG
jgi:cell wall-associated NlpC family hydrolase